MYMYFCSAHKGDDEETEHFAVMSSNDVGTCDDYMSLISRHQLGPTCEYIIMYRQYESYYLEDI